MHTAPQLDNLSNARELIKDKLYFVSLPNPPQPSPNVHFFTVDNQFVYTNFYADFGPSNIAHVVRFCELMQSKFQNPVTSNQAFCLYSSYEIDRRANAAFLISAYMMIIHNKSPEESFAALVDQSPTFVPYRDAGYGPATYHLTILDCLRGLQKVMTIGIFDLQRFDAEEYEFYERVENGDFNWITPKFLALANPKDDQPFPDSKFSRRSKNGKDLYSCYRSSNLVRWMLENNIMTIIRLNDKTYDRQPFLDAGIEHIELFFPDGSSPPDSILRKFLEICETRQGPIAVHCKAGLGRTGSLISAYLMKHYRLTANQVISFLRIIRPGSVVGPQQNYLEAIQPKMWKLKPLVELSVEISCLASVHDLTRFASSKDRLTPQPKLFHAGILKSNQIYQDVKEFELKLAQERLTIQAVENLSIPIQPRKYLPNHKVKIESINIVDQPQYYLRSSRRSDSNLLLTKPRKVGGVDGILDSDEILIDSEVEVPAQARLPAEL